MQLVGQSAAPDWECTWGRPLKMKFREDGMELWLPMVISINLANSFLAQAGRPQTPERHWLTFRFLNSYPFLPPSWNAVPFVQMFFLILLSNTTEQLVTSVTAQLSFLGHFSEDSSGFPEYWIHWYGIDSNLMISPFCVAVITVPCQSVQNWHIFLCSAACSPNLYNYEFTVYKHTKIKLKADFCCIQIWRT